MSNTPNLPQEDLARISLSNVPAVPDSPDIYTELDKLNLENERLELLSKKQDLSHRKWFTIGIFALMCLWLAFIGFVALIDGFGSFYMRPFHLEPSIVIVLAGTTTVNVIGLCYVIAKYLFRVK